MILFFVLSTYLIIKLKRRTFYEIFLFPENTIHCFSLFFNVNYQISSGLITFIFIFFKKLSLSNIEKIMKLCFNS